MSRYILAFDTATEHVAIALGAVRGDSVVAIDSLDFLAPRAALARLLPSIQDLLACHAMGVRDLEAIVVGRGPGSFTGVRIGVATAKGLSQGMKVPLHGVGTLDAVAWNLRDHGGLVGVLGDAMRGEVYPALYRATGDSVERLSAERVADPAQVAREWERLGEPIVITGNALGKYADLFDGVGTLAPEALRPVLGGGLLAAYERAIADGSLGDGDPGVLLPVYTRLSDAEENERARIGSCESSLPDNGVAGPMDGGC
ncbi:MAG: tRNA (adenosine(37)-N6)-threonylcarbamoyltransferase complex dimerization subunit type 1 TsaB [Actinobacteria bacterium HGW-Actinobacteria-10]|nr:MAG: tRNA (adenosine(37)-N6)-threonylcarbamoyltransferase complex dimerization subunit type 1 TsaB [Actinobacteria bacterium HGW-Actinobacteria-10]